MPPAHGYAHDPLAHIRARVFHPQRPAVGLAKCESLISTGNLAGDHRIMTLVNHGRSDDRNLIALAEAHAITLKKTERRDMHLQNSGAGFEH